MPTERRVFTLSDAAHLERETVETVARDVQILPDTSSAFRAHLSEWPSIFARLALTFHALESPQLEAVISGETARKVAVLMIDSFLPHAARFNGDVLGHAHMKHSRWIAGYILSHGKERITAREIGRARHELYQDRTALLKQRTHFFLAERLFSAPLDSGEGEHIEIVPTSVTEALARAERGEFSPNIAEAIRKQNPAD